MQTNDSRRKVNPHQVMADLALLSNAQLERLLPQVFALRTSRSRDVLTRREALLLKQIHRRLPTHLQTEFNRLVGRRRDGTLAEGEVRRLHQLTNQIELRDASRLKSLVELAGLRKTTLEKLMRSLGLKTPTYA